MKKIVLIGDMAIAKQFLLNLNGYKFSHHPYYHIGGEKISITTFNSPHLADTLEAFAVIWLLPNPSKEDKLSVKIIKKLSKDILVEVYDSSSNEPARSFLEAMLTCANDINKQSNSSSFIKKAPIPPKFNTVLKCSFLSFFPFFNNKKDLSSPDKLPNSPAAKCF